MYAYQRRAASSADTRASRRARQLGLSCSLPRGRRRRNLPGPTSGCISWGARHHKSRTRPYLVEVRAEGLGVLVYRIELLQRSEFRACERDARPGRIDVEPDRRMRLH